MERSISCSAKPPRLGRPSKALEAFVNAVAVDIHGLHSTADLGRLFENHDFLPGPLQGFAADKPKAGPDHHDRHRSDALRRHDERLRDLGSKMRDLFRSLVGSRVDASRAFGHVAKQQLHRPARCGNTCRTLQCLASAEANLVVGWARAHDHVVHAANVLNGGSAEMHDVTNRVIETNPTLPVAIRAKGPPSPSRKGGAFFSVPPDRSAPSRRKQAPAIVLL